MVRAPRTCCIEWVTVTSDQAVVRINLLTSIRRTIRNTRHEGDAETSREVPAFADRAISSTGNFINQVSKLLVERDMSGSVSQHGRDTRGCRHPLFWAARPCAVMQMRNTPEAEGDGEEGKTARQDAECRYPLV